jgi:PAS domain S-box-containing protein
MKGKKNIMFETKGRHKSGKDLDISVTLDAIRDDDGEILGFSILSRNITERREAEQRISFLNSLLTTVKNINHLTGHESDLETLFQSAAEIMLTTRGYRNASVGIIDEKDSLLRIISHCGIHHRNKWFVSIIPEIAEPCIVKVLDSRSTFIIDNTMDYCSGCDFCAHEDAHKTIIVPMSYRKTIKGLIFFCLVPEHEISREELELLEEVGRNLAVAHAEIMAEEALHYTEERYALARKAAQIGSWDWNLKTGKLELSEEVECILGFRPGEFTSKYDAFLVCVHPNDRDYVETMINDCIKNGGDYAIEHRIVWPDGTLRRIAKWGRVYLDKDKKAKRMIGIVQDITKRVWADQIQAVQEASEFAESIIAAVREPLVVLDKDLRVVSANPAFYSTFQMEPEKTEQELLYKLTDQQWNIPGLRRLLMKVIQENTPFDDFTVTYTLPIGKERTILMNARQIFHETEKPPMVLMEIEDITDRR